jgi:tetratricopeptide (TPR) repeat protein
LNSGKYLPKIHFQDHYFMKTIWILLPFIFIMFQCTGRPSSPEFEPQAVSIYEQANALLAENADSALLLFDQALAIDASFYPPHTGKIRIYLERAQYSKALYECEQLIMKKPESAEAWTLSGMLHEWFGNKGTATNYYTTALNIYNNRIEQKKGRGNQHYADRLNRAYTLVLLGNSEAGLQEIQSMKNDNPDYMVIDELLLSNKNDFMYMVMQNLQQF